LLLYGLGGKLRKSLLPRPLQKVKAVTDFLASQIVVVVGTNGPPPLTGAQSSNTTYSQRTVSPLMAWLFRARRGVCAVRRNRLGPINCVSPPALKDHEISAVGLFEERKAIPFLQAGNVCRFIFAFGFPPAVGSSTTTPAIESSSSSDQGSAGLVVFALFFGRPKR
jgi:hypothetical protein